MRQSGFPHPVRLGLQPGVLVEPHTLHLRRRRHPPLHLLDDVPRLVRQVSFLAGAKNLTDKNYTLVDGFPEEGRSYYASVRVRY